MTETALVVELASDTDADSVNLINPNGEMNSLQRVQEGATQVTFQLLGETEDGYTPEYHVVAVAGDKTIGETTISLEPQVTITDVIWAQNNPDMDWEKKSGSAWQQFAALTVKNTGNAPTYLTAVEWRNSPQAKVSASETVTTNLNRLLSPRRDDHLRRRLSIRQKTRPVFTELLSAVSWRRIRSPSREPSKLERIRRTHRRSSMVERNTHVI